MSGDTRSDLEHKADKWLRDQPRNGWKRDYVAMLQNERENLREGLATARSELDEQRARADACNVMQKEQTRQTVTALDQRDDARANVERIRVALSAVLDDAEAYVPSNGTSFNPDEIEFACPWCEARTNAKSREQHDDECYGEAAQKVLHGTITFTDALAQRPEPTGGQR